MRVRMRTVYAGASGCAGAGQVIDLPEAEARALMAGNYASAVETAEAPAPEAAITQPAETAVVPGAPEVAAVRPRRPRRGG